MPFGASGLRIDATCPNGHGIGTRAGTSLLLLCCCVVLSEEETFRRIGAAVRVEHLPSAEV